MGLQMLPLLPIPLPLLRPLPKRSLRRESSRRNLRRQQLKLRVETEHIKCCCCCCSFVSAHTGNLLPPYLSSLLLSLSILSTLSARVGVGNRNKMKNQTPVNQKK